MASDPIPEEDVPPRLRFERLVKGPEPHVFKSVRPDPAADPDRAADPAADPDRAADPPSPESDASILERFDALKRSLAGEFESAPPRPPDGERASYTGGPIRPDERPETLQDRISQARREEGERASRDPVPEEGMEPSEGDGRERRRARRKTRSFWQEFPVLVLVALVVAVIIKTFFFQAFYIPSGSMIPTLEVNDRVLVNKLSYRFGAIERGDILVFDSPEAIHVDRSFIQRVFRSIGEATGITSPETVLIKRVIGLPGESVEIQDNQVYVNGRPIAEPYLPDGTTMRDFDEIVVPADRVFMMGDNRNQSRDSRVFGPIPREDIVGRAFVKVWPPGSWTGL